MKQIIVTIGRQFGSGGRDIGLKVAQKLGAQFYDSELLTQAAKDSGISQDVFDSYDEKRTNSLLYSLSMGSYGFSPDSAQPLALKVYLAQFSTIKKLVRSGEPAVFVGRCADYVLHDVKGLVSVFISADEQDRIDNICKREGVTTAQAKSLMNKKDKGRESYYNYHTEYKWGEAKTYDLCINTSKIGTDGAVQLILDYIDKLPD